MTSKVFLVVTISCLTLIPIRVCADPNKNVQVMVDAARQLTWEAWEGQNHAYFLVKQEAVLSPVAVIFGYADNAAACEALAVKLSQPVSIVGTFKCQPIF